MKSLIDTFNAIALNQPHHIAIYEGSEEYTFERVDRLSNQVAAQLQKQGVQHQDKVGLYCINSASFAIAYLGILKAGAVVVPINLLQTVTEIDYVLENAEAKVLIYHQAFSENAQQLIEQQQLESIEIPAVLSSAEDWVNTLTETALKPVVIDPMNDLAAILYTSGTTGKPKGAMLTHANLVANTQSVYESMKWQGTNEIVALVLPMFHAFAATVGMLTTLTSGCGFVPVPKFDTELLLATIERHKATVFLGVPSLYNALLKVKDDQVSRFSSIKLCVSGGASLPVEVMEQFEAKYQVPIYEGDGPTECSPVTCVNPVGGKRKAGTVGLPVSRVEMKILNEKGQPCENGVIGEIAVRGPNVMKGYWKNPEATAESFFKDWFLTGDLGTEDDEGYFSILDRKKDMIIVNGMNVYPRVIEEVLYKHDAVREAAVIGEPDDLHGEIPVAYLALNSDTELTVSDVKRWCREYLGSYEIPRRVRFLDDLPKNAAGKIVKRVLNKQGEVERGVT